MVHVEKFTVKGNIYYKLVHSVRKAGKVKSKSKYLGKVLPAAKELEKLKKQFYDEIQAKKLATSNEQLNAMPLRLKGMPKPETIPRKLRQPKIVSQPGLKLSNPISNAMKLQNFDIMSNMMSEIVYSADPISLEITYITPNVEKILGYGSNHWLANPMLLERIIYPPDRKKIIDLIKQSSTQAINLRYRIISGGGEIIWVSHRTILEKAPTGNRAQIIGIIKNISEDIKQAAKIKYLYEESPVSMMELDLSALKKYLDGKKMRTAADFQNYFLNHPKGLKDVQNLVQVTSINKSFLKLFNTTNRKLLLQIFVNKNFLRTSNDVFLKELAAITQNEDHFESPLSVYDMVGKRLDVLYSWNIPREFRKNYRKVLVRIINTSIQRELVRSMSVKNFAIEASPSGLLITSLTGKISYANNAFFKLWGIEDSSLVLLQPVEKYLPHKVGAMRILQEVHQKKEWHGVIILGDSKKVYLETHAGLVVDDFNEPLGMVFSFINITELKKSEQIRLEFTNIAAHELKTPVVPLKTFLTMMYEDPQEFGINEKGMKNLVVCLRNVNRLSVLIGDILDISRLEAGGMKFISAKYDLVKMLKTVLADYAGSIKEHGLILRQQIPEKIPLLWGDVQRISQVVGNLIKNAINFTPTGTIFVKVDLQPDYVQVNVIDSGVGIAKSSQAKLFTKFYQAQNITTRGNKGTGLGLAISKGIIEHHGGIIFASSEGKLKGSTFSFILPFKKITFKSREQKNKLESMGDKLLLQSDKRKRHLKNL